MPFLIVFMGITFNIANTLMQGGWLFYVSPENYYTLDWLKTPQFIVGTAIFIIGFIINLHSDYIIRHLRKDGDTKYYFPKKGMYKYVSSANYFGEVLEWTGFAILTWSLAGAVFAIWTFANLAPRAYRLNKKYKDEFPAEYAKIKPRSIIPFIL
jgi:3-oxo-5-alpha-steroid 4-dehydrogenase 1